MRYATNVFRTSPTQSLYCEEEMTSSHQLMLLRYVAKTIILSSHIKNLLRSTFTRPTRIARYYNFQAPHSVRSALLASQIKLLDIASRSKKLCHPTELKHLFRSVPKKYIKEHIIVYIGRRRAELVVRLSSRAPPTPEHCSRREVYTPVSYTHLISNISSLYSFSNL